MGGCADRVEHAVHGAGVVVAGGFLQHVANVHDQQAEVGGGIYPLLVFTNDLQARLGGGGQDGQQVDVAMGGCAQCAGVFLA